MSGKKNIKKSLIGKNIYDLDKIDLIGKSCNLDFDTIKDEDQKSIKQLLFYIWTDKTQKFNKILSNLSSIKTQISIYISEFYLDFILESIDNKTFEKKKSKSNKKKSKNLDSSIDEFDQTNEKLVVKTYTICRLLASSFPAYWFDPTEINDEISTINSNKNKIYRFVVNSTDIINCIIPQITKSSRLKLWINKEDKNKLYMHVDYSEGFIGQCSINIQSIGEPFAPENNELKMKDTFDIIFLMTINAFLRVFEGTYKSLKETIISLYFSDELFTFSTESNNKYILNLSLKDSETQCYIKKDFSKFNLNEDGAVQYRLNLKDINFYKGICSISRSVWLCLKKIDDGILFSVRFLFDDNDGIITFNIPQV